MTTITPPFTGSYGSTLQGINVTTYERFGMSVAPKMGRSDQSRILLSSSLQVLDVTPSNNDFFDDSLKLPSPISFISGATVANQQVIGEDDWRTIELPQYHLNRQTFGLDPLFTPQNPFVEMDEFNPVKYIESPWTMAWPVVMENPSPIDPFDFNGAIEPFAIRKPLAGFSTFLGTFEDPEPTGIRGSVASGMIQEVFYKRSVVASNWYIPNSLEIEPFEQIGAGEEYDEWTPSYVATGSLTFTGYATIGEIVTLRSADGTSKTYTAAMSESLSLREFTTGSAVAGGLPSLITSLKNCINNSAGHNDKIYASGSATKLTLWQVTAGYSGNTVITSSLLNATSASFVGGTGIWKPIHDYVKALPYMTDATASLSPYVDAMSNADAFIGISSTEIRNLMIDLSPKINILGRPSINDRSAGCGMTYVNNSMGVDSIAFGGQKK